jgi:RecB family endonuclease NucS
VILFIKIIFPREALHSKTMGGTIRQVPAATPRPARHVAVEVKRRAGIDAVEQLSRYVELLDRDPLLTPVGGILAAQSITPQARTLAGDRGLRCVLLDYEAMRGIQRDEQTLF